MASKRGLKLFLSVAAASLVMLGAIAASASAFSYGVMWRGTLGATETEMETVGSSGAELMRVPLLPQEVPYGNWKLHYDTIFRRAAENNVRILPVIQTGEPSVPLPPSGAGPVFGGEQSWQQWVEEAVKRYGLNGSFWAENPALPAHPVTTWELGNEPNNVEVPAFAQSAKSYGEFVAWAGPVIQAASKAQAGVGTEVLFAGLFLWGNKIPFTNGLDYLKKAWEVSGVPNAVTGVAIHPYELKSSEFFKTGATRLEAFAYAVDHFRSGVSEHLGLNQLAQGKAKTMWITEAGWPAEGPKWSVGPTSQATLLTQSFEWSVQHAPALGLQGMVWYNFRDTVGESVWADYCGLIDHAGNKRPSWTAFQALTHATPGPDVKVAFRDFGNANSLSGWQYNSTTGWQQIAFWGHEVAAGTKPVILRYNESTHIFYVDGSRENRITEWAWNKTTGWQQHPIESDPVAAGSSPTGVVLSGLPRLFFADAGTNREVTMLAFNGSIWSQTRFYGDPVMQNSSPSAAVAGSSIRVFFADAALSDTMSTWEVTPTSITQIHFYGNPVAPGSSPSAVQTPGSTQAFFSDAAMNDNLSVWTWAPTAIVQQHLYTDRIANNTSPSAIVTPSSTEIYFSDESQGRTVSVWVWTPSTLTLHPLYQDPVAANTSPTAIAVGETAQVFFSDEATNGSIGLWEWGPSLTLTRFYGHLVAPGSSPGA